MDSSKTTINSQTHKINVRERNAESRTLDVPEANALLADQQVPPP